LALTGLVKHPANLAALRDEMDRVVPWGALVQIVEPHAPRAKTGRPPFAIETICAFTIFMYGPDAFCKGIVTLAMA
jgi:hypothetical protein